MQLSERFACNIEISRASINETICDYFDDLCETVASVPLSHIVNYDETKFTDDPGREKVICKRGTKRC